MGDPDNPRPSGLPNRKRKRVSVACRSCRTRKSRCDGGRPCTTCQEMETDCVYDQPYAQSAPGPSVDTNNRDPEQSLLNQRLLAIEQKLQLLVDDSSSLSQRNLRRRLQSPEDQTSILTPAHSTEPCQATAELPDSSGDVDEGVDGMGAIALKDGADEEEYFGPSSNVAFLRLIILSIGRPITESNGIGSTMDRPIDQSDETTNAFLKWPFEASCDPEIHKNKHSELFALPPRSEIDFLVQLYFSTINMLLPCLHEDTFNGMYQKLLSDGPHSIRRSWLAVLNLMLALATNVMTATSPTRERATRSDMFFGRAMGLVRSNMLGRLSVEIVQVFLLAEIYLEGTTSSSLTWTYHSLAVKGAYQLGLHTVPSKDLSHVEREIRRRLWYWCVMNDRFLSVTYGRPPLIPLSHVRLEPCSYIEFSKVPNVTLSVGYFDALLSLSHLMGEGVDRLYDQNLGHRTTVHMSETLSQISQLRWQLAQWQDNLPSYLKIITLKDTLDVDPINLETTRVQILLSLRYLGARILILRPILTQLLGLSSISSNVHQSEWLQSSGVALLTDLVKTCNDVLHVSKNILVASQNDRNLLGAWWFSCYYTFNAALAVLGVLLIKKQYTVCGSLLSYSLAELRAMLDTAMEILHGLDRGNKTILRCRHTLTRLLNMVDIDRITPTSFSLSPSSAWAWQLMDPGLFMPEASLSLAPGAFDFS